MYALAPQMRPLHRPIVEITVGFEYLALDEVRRTHRAAMILAGIPRSNTIRRLERRAILRNGLQFQSLETCPSTYRTLNAILRIIRLVNNCCAAFDTVGSIGVNSLGIPTIGRIIHLRTRLGITWIRGSSIGEDILIRCARHLRECLLLLIRAASGLKVGSGAGMIRAADIRISAANNAFLRVER